MKLTAVLLSLAMLTGCATMRRHPVASGLVIGAAAGVVVGLETRNVTCHYDGQNVGVYPKGHCPR